MKVVYKYQLSIQIESSVNLPVGAEILRAGAQGNNFVLWALVDKEQKETVEHKILLLPTGKETSYENLTYINTFFVDENVFHVFEC